MKERENSQGVTSIISPTTNGRLIHVHDTTEVHQKYFNAKVGPKTKQEYC